MGNASGVFALLGVAIGVVGTLLAGWQHRRWEGKLRTQEARRKAFVAMASAPLLVLFDSQLIVARRAVLSSRRAEDSLAQMRVSLKAIVEAASEVFIFATLPEVTRSTREVLEVSEQVGGLMERRKTKPQDWEAVRQRMSDARMRFIEEARRELKIKGKPDELFPFDGESQSGQLA